MKALLTALATAGASTIAWADKYGIDEAMRENAATERAGGSDGISDVVWGALLVGVAYWLWKKFFG